jgi:hypothetical protein
MNMKMFQCRTVQYDGIVLTFQNEGVVISVSKVEKAEYDKYFW